MHPLECSHIRGCWGPLSNLLDVESSFLTNVNTSLEAFFAKKFLYLPMVASRRNFPQERAKLSPFSKEY
jgi:hypothetical protein